MVKPLIEDHHDARRRIRGADRATLETWIADEMSGLRRRVVMNILLREVRRKIREEHAAIMMSITPKDPTLNRRWKSAR